MGADFPKKFLETMRKKKRYLKELIKLYSYSFSIYKKLLNLLESGYILKHYDTSHYYFKYIPQRLDTLRLDFKCIIECLDMLRMF